MINTLSNLEHMFEETRDDISLMCFLLKIHDKFEVSAVFDLVGHSSNRNINMFTSDPLIEVIFNLKEMLGNRNNFKLNVNIKIRLTTVCTKALVAIGSTLFSENSGCIIPSSSLFLNQTLLTRVCIRGAQNMPVFNMGSCS